MLDTYRRSKPGRKTRWGVLLLEILLAIALLVGSVLLVLGVFPQAIAANQQGKGLLLATNLAQKEMEACRAMTLPQLTQDIADNPEVATTYSATVRGVEQSMDFVVKREAADAVTGLKEVTITVEWQDKVGAHRTQITTLVGEGF